VEVLVAADGFVFRLLDFLAEEDAENDKDMCVNYWQALALRSMVQHTSNSNQGMPTTWRIWDTHGNVVR